MLRPLLCFALIVPFETRAQLNCTFQVAPENCSLMNGTADAFVSGGTPPYNYLWSPTPWVGQGTPNISGLADGSYDLTVTDDLGFQQTFTAVVPDDPQMGIVGEGTYVGAHAATGFGIPCEGQCNGAMAMPAIMYSGTPPYMFDWSDPGISFLALTSQDDPVFHGFCAGQSYNYTVYDMFGCTGTSMYFTPFVVEDTMHWYVDQVVPATCGNADGMVHLAQDGGWPADMVLTDAGGMVVNSSNTGMGSHTVSGLAAGNYSAFFNYGTSACTSLLTFAMTEVGPGCGSVTGTLYVDSDADCVADAGEPGIPYRTLQVDPGAQLLITNADGTYNGGFADGAYTMTVLDPTVTPACPQAQPIPFNVSGNLTSLDIGASSTSPMDLAVNAVNSAARPGFTLTTWGQVMNLGNIGSNSAVLTAVLDPSLSYLSAVPAPTNVLGGTITWNLSALAPFASTGIQLMSEVSTQVVLGQQVNVTFSIVNNGPEANTTNNSFTATRTVTGSYDPNDKTAITSTRWSSTDYVIGQDEHIDYVIRFQNTGTDTAFTVVITDTLDTDLDMTTFEQGAASHPFTVSFLLDRVVEWRFANILLPDSTTNEAGSHGAVGFRIRPAQPLSVGTLLSNNADIFFDFNAPIRTNTSELVAAVSTGMQGPEQVQVRIFPNPAHDRFIISTSGASLQHVRLLSLDGRVVHQKALSGDRAEVPVPGLAPGSYLVLVADSDGIVVPRRITVQ